MPGAPRSSALPPLLKGPTCHHPVRPKTARALSPTAEERHTDVKAPPTLDHSTRNPGFASVFLQGLDKEAGFVA